MASKSSRVVRTSKSVVVISVNPSDSLGSRYLEANPVNASFGRIFRFSGLLCVVCQHCRDLFRSVANSRNGHSPQSSNDCNCLIGEWYNRWVDRKW